MLKRATRASYEYVDEWLLELSKADAVDRDRRISSNIFDEELVSVSLLMLLMLSQESFREILAFFFEITRLGRVFEQIADGFFRVPLHLPLEFPSQGF